MTEAQKRTIAQNFIRALSTGDRALLADTLTADVVWSIPGESWMSGEPHGIDATMARSARFKEYNVRIEIEHVVYGFKDVALHLHNTGTHDRRTLTSV
jgi:ketosteroid isomerase-like protein